MSETIEIKPGKNVLFTGIIIEKSKTTPVLDLEKSFIRLAEGEKRRIDAHNKVWVRTADGWTRILTAEETCLKGPLIVSYERSARWEELTYYSKKHVNWKMMLSACLALMTGAYALYTAIMSGADLPDEIAYAVQMSIGTGAFFGMMICFFVMRMAHYIEVTQKYPDGFIRKMTELNIT
jgi:hypothetical protein